MEIVDFVFSPFAAASAILEEFDKMDGTLVVEIGEQVTSYVLYYGGIVRSSGILPIGGFNISNDLSIGLGISLDEAEKIKIENGTGNYSASLIEGRGGGISNDETLSQISLRNVEEIVLPRCEELFALIKSDVVHDPSFERMNGNIVLSGGGSKLIGIESVAEGVFGLRVLTGRMPDVVVLNELVADESWNVCIGLLHRGGEILAEGNEEKRGTKDYFNWVVEGFKRVTNTF